MKIVSFLYINYFAEFLIFQGFAKSKGASEKQLIFDCLSKVPKRFIIFTEAKFSVL